MVKSEFKFIVEAHKEWVWSRGEVGLRADFTGMDLQGANLRHAYLGFADFRGADLRGANFEGSNLYGADFRGADLRGARLKGVELTRALVEGALLDKKPKGAIF